VISINEKLNSLPLNPGVYLMYDSHQTVIYVGKAKNLKNRIKTYFTTTHSDTKTIHLVKNIANFSYIITNTEQEAFLLEANLIKQYQPRYNIILKDDKKYPFIKIHSKECFPRVEITRDIVKDGNQYYGPYVNSKHLNKLLRELIWIFPYRSCKKKINSQVFTPNIHRACLNHQLNKCPAPCIGNISKDDYSKQINKISKYLLGRGDDLIKEMKEEMQVLSENLNFEMAAKIRDKIKYLQDESSKQVIYFNDLEDRDIIAFYKEEKYTAVAVLKMIDGKISDKRVYSFIGVKNESPESIFRAFLLQHYLNKMDKLPYQLLLQIEPEDYESLNILFQKKIIVPVRGENKQLIEIAKKNAFDHVETLKLQYYKKATRTIIPIQELKEQLGLRKLPRKMVCIDVSTIQGSETVAALVFFENGKPLKKHYRHFIIKSVIGQDDYASIRETLNRYLIHITASEESDSLSHPTQWETPDLIVIDGGKGQLSSARKMLLGFGMTHIELISISEKFENVFTTNSKDAIILPRNSSGLKLLIKLRDETHRFAVTHHRKRFSKRVLTSKLDSVKGLGEEKKFLMLKEFGSVENILGLKKQDLMKIKGIGAKLADSILNIKL
jgi:excinuclease ABC subunit C